ncbi:g4868 [Coccomyxa elongata]
MHLALREWAEQLGGIYCFRITIFHVVVVVDAHLANLVLGNGYKLSKALEPPLSDELLSLKGHPTMFSASTDSEYWALLRKGTAPALNPRNIRDAFPAILKVLEQVISNVTAAGPGCEVDVNNLAMRFAMDVTGIFIFAKDFGTARSFNDSNTDELFVIMKHSLEELMLRCVNPLRKFMVWNREVRHGTAIFRAFRSAMVDLVKEVKARGEPAPGDATIAAHLLRLRDPATGGPLSDELLAGEFGMFFTAGLETSGNAISWTLYLLSQHPDVERKLAQELDAAGLLVTPERPNPRPMEFADLAALPYLSWVSKEAMRVRPVASTGTSRVTKTDMVIGGHLIPGNSFIVVPFDAVHHWAGNWPDQPHAFIPERWAAQGSELAAATGTAEPRPLTGAVTASLEVVGYGSPVKGAPSPGAKRMQQASPYSSPIKAAAEASAAAGAAAKRFMPFSLGPRQCLGQSLGRVMHDTAVARIVSAFRLELAPRMGGAAGVDAAAINRLTLQPGEGMWMRCHPRGQLSAGC